MGFSKVRKGDKAEVLKGPDKGHVMKVVATDGDMVKLSNGEIYLQSQVSGTRQLGITK